MPAGGGAVYQPTTVSYQPRCASERGGILGGNSGIGVESPLRMFRKSRPQVALLVFALLSLVTGVAMLASVVTDWLDAKNAQVQEHEQDNGNTATITPIDETYTAAEGIEDVSEDVPMSVLFGGVFMTLLGFFALGMYLKVADWRRNCICPCNLFDKKQSLAREMDAQNGGGGGAGNSNANGTCGQSIMALNPSTDPLVSHTQYAAVSELPCMRPEDEERRNLMPDNKDKDCVSSAEESDRMLEPDPRIVLRPMQHVEDA